MISTKQAAAILGVSDRRVRALCKQGRIQGAVMVGKAWVLPDVPVVLPVTRRKRK